MSSAAQQDPAPSSPEAPHKAGAFDVRSVIAGLIGFYGLVLVVLGLVHDTSAEQQKTGGVNANLWAGIVMLLVAAGFALWTRLRPIVVDEEALREAHAENDGPPAH